MAPSIRSLLSFTSGLFTQVPLADNPPPNHPSTALINGPSCPANGPLSCHNHTAAPDSCCFIYPGGQLLQTQFWDTYPSVGPSDSWTLHGLWPDLCDGTYPTYCHSAPIYHNITSILSSSSSSPTLLSYMLKYWLPNHGTPDYFWTHEWNKHGTCINTLSPSCYSPSTYIPGAEVVDFFTQIVDLFKKLDTFRALEMKGIVPSKHRRYKREEIEEALRAVTGSEVLVRCDRGDVLNEVWYSFNVKGSLQGGEFVASDPAGKAGRGGCPRKGIRYLPK